MLKSYQNIIFKLLVGELPFESKDLLSTTEFIMCYFCNKTKLYYICAETNISVTIMAECNFCWMIGTQSVFSGMEGEQTQSNLCVIFCRGAIVVRRKNNITMGFILRRMKMNDLAGGIFSGGKEKPPNSSKRRIYYANLCLSRIGELIFLLLCCC